MKKFLRYFFYIFKRSLPRLAVMTAIVLVMAVALIEVRWYTDNYTKYEPYTVLTITLEGTVPLLLCAVVAAAELFRFKSKTWLDGVFSLPISRGSVALAHYLNGVIHIFVMLAVNLAVTLVKFIPFWDACRIYMLPVYTAVCFLFCLVVYSVCMFAFDRANTVFDGLLFEAGYLFVTMPAVWIYGAIVNDAEIIWHYYDDSHIFTQLRRAIDIFEHNALWVKSRLVDAALDFKSCLFWLIFGFLCAVGFFFTFGRKRPEKAGGVSDSIFGYTVMLPLFAMGFMSVLIDTGGIVACVALPIMALCYIIYRRSVRLKPIDLLSIGVSAAYMTAVLLLY